MLTLGQHGFVLCELFSDVCVRVNVRVEDMQASCAERNLRGERQPRSPRALHPRQLDAPRGEQREATQQRHARVARVVNAYALLEIEIPLSLLRRFAARDTERRGRVMERKRLRQLPRGVTAACTLRAAISFL